MPSESVLNAKKQVVSELIEKLKAVATGVVIDYRGLSVEEDTELRRKFREAGVEYSVVKNTLLRFASKEVGLGELDEVLHGPTAIATHNEDLVAPAKIFADFAKTHEKVSIKAGFMEGNVISIDEVKALAATPSKEILISKLMGSMNAPISALARLLNTIVENGVELDELVAAKAAE